jgi:hypothetical protein
VALIPIVSSRVVGIEREELEQGSKSKNGESRPGSEQHEGWLLVSEEEEHCLLIQ